MSRDKWILTGLIAVLVAFGGGYLASWLPARQTISELEASVEAAEAESEQTKAELQRAQLEVSLATLLGQLGQVYVDINANNFGMAAEKVTPFFNGLSALLESDPALSEPRLQALRGISSRRDEIVTDLAQANPQVRQKVGEMFSRLRAQLGN
ncbi:MAG TPA: hypothetical protein VGC53_07215 [Vicinamibacteria bacterium]|jgi:hypothetical protein